MPTVEELTRAKDTALACLEYARLLTPTPLVLWAAFVAREKTQAQGIAADTVNMQLEPIEKALADRLTAAVPDCADRGVLLSKVAVPDGFDVSKPRATVAFEAPPSGEWGRERLARFLEDLRARWLDFRMKATDRHNSTMTEGMHKLFHEARQGRIDIGGHTHHCHHTTCLLILECEKALEKAQNLWESNEHLAPARLSGDIESALEGWPPVDLDLMELRLIQEHHVAVSLVQDQGPKPEGGKSKTRQVWRPVRGTAAALAHADAEAEKFVRILKKAQEIARPLENAAKKAQDDTARINDPTMRVLGYEKVTVADTESQEPKDRRPALAREAPPAKAHTPKKAKSKPKTNEQGILPWKVETWEQLSVGLCKSKDGEPSECIVEIRFDGKTTTKGFTELGMRKGNPAVPNMDWDLLLELLRTEKLTQQKKGMHQSQRRQAVSRLRKQLKELCCIDDDPFETRERRGTLTIWKPKFGVHIPKTRVYAG